MKKILAITLAASMLTLTACGNSDNNKDAKDEKNNVKIEQKADNKSDNKSKEVSISEWEGIWNNMGGYLNNPELDKAYEQVAKRDKKDVKQVKDELIKKRQTDFEGIEIKGNKVTFLDGFKDKGGKEISSAEYKFVKSFQTKHGNDMLEWDQFEATSKDAKYPVLIMMPIHGEESLTHFHMRYGKNIDELLKKDKWFPTYVKPSTTTDQLIDEITE